MISWGTKRHRRLGTPGPVLVVLLALVLVAILGASCTRDSEATGPSTEVAGVTTSSVPEVCEPDVDPVVESVAVPGSPTDVDVTSFDGTRIRAHWFPVEGVAGPSPTVLMGPGWGMAGDTAVDVVGVFGAVNIDTLQAAGYNVLTWDPRGFGASDGTAMVDSVDYEARDVQQLLTWVAARPEAQSDGPLDPTVGMVGGSYGGGIQNVTGAIDCRLDALVPIVAWHSLITSLYKDQTYKQGWAELLGSVARTARLDPMITEANQQGQRNGVLTDEQVDWFAARGPGDLVSQVQAPTLVVGGTIDTLFTLDESVTNHRLLQDAGTTVSMYWFCGGHGTCLTERGDPSRMVERIVAWLDRWVREDRSADTGPAFEFLDQHGTHYSSDRVPLPAGDPITASGSGRLDLRPDGGSGPAAVAESKRDVLSAFAGSIIPAPAENAVDVAIPVRSDAMVLGAPKLTIRYSGTTPPGEHPTRVFAQLVDRASGLVVGNQVTPVPVVLDGDEHTVAVPLEQVVHLVGPSSDLVLQVVATTTLYGDPRFGGSVELSKVSVELPTVTGYRQLQG